MSMYADSELSGRFAALAPEPLSGNWDEVLDRAGMARNGRQRFERSRAVPGRRRRLVVVLAVLAVAAAAATAGWAIVREVVLHKSFIGLPPVGATRSAPESGELVIQYWIDPDGGFAGGRGWVYADGRLITLRGNGFLEQRLTPEGVELLRSELVSTGLFDHHQPAGRNPSPHGVIQVRIGERLVRIQGCPGCPTNVPERLGERLADAASWLPASAWKDRQIRAYVASRYTISYFAQPQTLERSRILSLLPAAAEDLLRAKDTVPEHWYTAGSADQTPIPITNYVSYLTTEEARALAQALDDAGLKQEPANRGELGYRFEIPGTSVDSPVPEKGRVRNEVVIYFYPSLPHGEHVCSGCG
jgi:hypothetical protein